LIIDYDGQRYPFDMDDVTVKQGLAIEEHMKCSFDEWGKKLMAGTDLRARQALGHADRGHRIQDGEARPGAQRRLRGGESPGRGAAGPYRRHLERPRAAPGIISRELAAVLGRDLAVTRARNLFDLAHLCSVSPPEVNRLTIPDFAQLVSGISAYKAASRARGET
jgi:hypothetical protein